MAQDFVFSASGMGGGGFRKEPPDGGGVDKRVLFKDKVIGNKKPMVHIADSIFEGLCAPWEVALVVKLLGKSIVYNVMKSRLTRLWRLTLGFDILDIGNNFYMVKFDTEMDRTKVMEEGPWMIFDHYLTV